MTERAFDTDPLQQAARDVAHHAPRNALVKVLARLGYIAIGIVYLLTAVLAARLALGIERVTPDKDRALLEILAAPFGRGLLGLIAAGLFGYALWRLFEGLLDVNEKGRGLGGLMSRAGYLISATFYGSLCFQATRMALGSYRGTGDASQAWAARLLAQPLGQWLVIALGVGIIAAAGVGQLIYAWQGGFKEHMNEDKMSPVELRWATLAGRIGYVARGFVLTLVGVFFVQAALSFDPSRAHSVGGTLAELAAGDSAWILGLAALGLAAYGLFCFTLARYHRVLCR